MRKIEIYKKDKIYATYYWDSGLFAYNSEVFAEKGDFMFATGGLETKLFHEVPYLFRRYLPTRGSANFEMMISRFKADPNDEFDIISKVGHGIIAPYSFRGVLE